MNLTGFQRIEGAAATWWFAAENAESLSPFLADAVERIEQLPGAAILREGDARVLVSLPLPSGGRAIAKVFLRKRGLQLLVDHYRSRALREANAIVVAAHAGIHVPRVVAFAVGYGPDVAGVLVTAAIEGAEPLQQVLDRAGRHLRGAAFRARRTLLLRLGDLVRRLDAAGWRHGDLHAGNVLLLPPTLEGEPHVVDWQRANKGHAFPPDLVDLVYSLSFSVPLSEQLALLRSGLPPSATKGLRREAMGWVRWRKERHLESRTARCLADGTEFAVDVEAGRRTHRQRTVPAESIREAVREHDAIVARGGLVKSLPKRRLSRFQLPGPGAPFPVYVKEYLYGPPRRVANLVVGTPARRAWVAAHGLRWRGIRSAEAIALVEEGHRSLLVMREVPGARTLTIAAAEASLLPTREKRAFLDRVARWVRRMHEEGVWHPDLKANNVLVDDTWELFLIDLDRTRFVGWLSPARREVNLAQLCAAIPRPLSRVDRMRVWRLWSRHRGTKEQARRIVRMAIARRHLWPGMENGPRG